MASHQSPLIFKLLPIIKNLVIKIILLTFLLYLFYLFGLNSFNITITSTTINVKTTTNITTTSLKTELKTESPVSAPLDFSPHHSTHLHTILKSNLKPIKKCAKNFTHYCPCQDSSRTELVRKTGHMRWERHCPKQDNEKLKCLIPRPPRYRKPFRWPKSKDMAWYNNVPFEVLVVHKKKQNWIRREGDRFIFPGGGTSFRNGVKGYIDVIKHVLPLKSGNLRTALDIGCGVATFGAALLDYNIMTMSIAPVDTHEAQVQFALERGVPAMIGVLSTNRLPYPSRSFDLAHCSRCLLNWTANDGLNLLEVDRILRPGGYWVLSGPPISWRISYKGWKRSAKDLEKEQRDLEELATRMCWTKVAENGPVAVWQKATNHVHCQLKSKKMKSLRFCEGNVPDAAWYKKMESCITPLPAVNSVKILSGGALEKWPRRLNAVPPRVTLSTILSVTSRTFNEDNQMWKRRVQRYAGVLTSLVKGEYRNVMDMNAGLGGFAAAMFAYPVWIMNVVPFDSKNNTLGVIYERGLIGTYMDWCEAFSTYPRTYDLIHADGLFTMYKDRCDAADILLEMYRILRPHGAVIVRDHVDTIFKVKDLMENMGWETKLSHSEHGPFHPEKVLYVGNPQNT